MLTSDKPSVLLNEHDLIDFSRQFDAQFSKMASLLSGSDDDIEADRMVAMQVIGSIDESCRQIALHLDGIEAGQKGAPSAQHLLATFKRMVGLERGSPNGSGSPYTVGTPPSITRRHKMERLGTPVRYIAHYIL